MGGIPSGGGSSFTTGLALFTRCYRTLDDPAVLAAARADPDSLRLGDRLWALPLALLLS